MNNFQGKNNPMWKGDKACYTSFHNWLNKHYGKANKCENPICPGGSNMFHWAKLKNKTYQHKRINYIMLCVYCHRLYDIKPNTNKKISNTLKGHKSWNNWINISRNNKGQFCSK